MKYVISIIITLILFVFLLFNTTGKSLTTSIVTVPYQFLNAGEKKQVDCLADNIFHEAASEPEEGKVAVGLVTLNRVKAKGFPDNVCDVVYQKTTFYNKVVCQFTWFCEGKKTITERQRELYDEARRVALYVYFNHAVIDDVTKGAIYYHADYVSPGWNRLEKTTQIGRHIFYIDPKQ